MRFSQRWHFQKMIRLIAIHRNDNREVNRNLLPILRKIFISRVASAHMIEKGLRQHIRVQKYQMTILSRFHPINSFFRG